MIRWKEKGKDFMADNIKVTSYHFEIPKDTREWLDSFDAPAVAYETYMRGVVESRNVLHKDTESICHKNLSS